MFNAINRFSIVAFQLICSMNVLLTNRELQIVTDAEVLITKNKIIKKVVQLFAGLSAQYAHQAQASGYETQWSAKISRGENYCGLPYVILDYPREFSRTDTRAIRSIFWWGHYFSITLQLHGSYLQHNAVALQEAHASGKFAGWHIATDHDAWNHHINAAGYTPAEKLPPSYIATLPFFKLAKKIPLNEWDSVEKFFLENFETLLQLSKP